MSYLFRNFNTNRHGQFRFFKKISSLFKGKGYDPTHDIISGDKLRNIDQYKFPAKLDNLKDRIPNTLEEQNELQQEKEIEISDIERRRMLKIDEVLGTKTHFHEVQEKYEERLDSEFIMEREQLKYKHAQEKEISLFDFDPQVQLKPPDIRNMREFKKQLKEIGAYFY